MIYEFINEADFFGLDGKGHVINPRVWRNLDDVPDDIKFIIVNSNVLEFGERDYLTPLAQSKAWLFELLLKYQPRTGQVLMDSGELWLRSIDAYSGPLLHMGITVNKKVILCMRDTVGYNFSDEKMESFIPSLERYLCLPEPIRLAYYNRFNGLKIPYSEAPGITGRLLPNYMGEWVSWSRYLEGFKGYKKLYLPWLAERIEGVAPPRKSASWTNFMLFLDSRPEGKGKEGDQLFVKTHVHDGVIYHVKDADIENMRILSNPAEAIDLYCEHVLLEKEGRFDFLPYTTQM